MQRIYIFKDSSGTICFVAKKDKNIVIENEEKFFELAYRIFN
jgi:hypothetical protein